jgi:tetratricopeptide (TPR) repeat protein
MLRKNYPAARAVFEDILARGERGVAHFDRLERPVVMLRIGESFLYEGRAAEAILRFETALADPATAPPLQALLYLRRGQAWDARRERERARADYQTTIQLNVDRASKRAARRFLETPFRPSGATVR